MDTGLDNGDGGGTAKDNTLQIGEIDATAYVCNGGPCQGYVYSNACCYYNVRPIAGATTADATFAGCMRACACAY